jgi:nicotinamidase/pyrazinamidase
VKGLGGRHGSLEPAGLEVCPPGLIRRTMRVPPGKRAARRPLHTADALILVDVQQDFLPGGALGVAHAEAIIPVLNRCIGEFHERGLPIFATRDWHPANHCSFRARGGPWPPHCIAGTSGAEFAEDLHLPREAHIVSKATSAKRDAYSGFEGTDLAAQLRMLGCQRVLIGGLATDYCVRATALDALDRGLEVIVLSDAVRAVDAQPGDGERALGELRTRGALLRHADEVCKGTWS